MEVLSSLSLKQMLIVPDFVQIMNILRVSSIKQRQSLLLKILTERMCVSLECMYKNMALTVLNLTIGKHAIKGKHMIYKLNIFK